jgi:hypothetical protein
MKFRITADQTVRHIMEIDAATESEARELFAKRPRHLQAAQGFRRLKPTYGQAHIVKVEKLGRWNEPGKAG